ncbi:MAG TPA: sensor histidine kinase [Bacilli bacterium]
MIKSVVAFFTKRLVNKLILLFTAIIVLVVGSLVFISYKNMERESVENSISSNTSNLNLVLRNLTAYFADVEQYTSPQINYDAVMNAIEHEKDDYTAKIYLDNYLRELYYARKDVTGIFLYLLEQHKYYYIAREGQNITVKEKYDDGIPRQIWFTQALQSNRNRYIQSLLYPQEIGYAFEPDDSFMVFHRTLRKLVNREPKAVISFFFSKSAIAQIIADIPLRGNEHVALLNERRDPFYVDDKTFYRNAMEKGLYRQVQQAQDKGRLTWKDDGAKYLVFFAVADTGQWMLVKPVPYVEMYEGAKKNRNVSILIGVMFLAVSFLFVTWTSNAITRPIKKLARKMDRFSGGEFNLELTVSGRDEIASLSRNFNEMVKRTNELINERYKSKLAEKSAILKALEAEINPHFLYNALQAISTKALKNGMDDIAGMVDSLAMTLRYCISGPDMVKISEEIVHIKQYMLLQQARFGARLAVSYQVDGQVGNVLIPKLAIQSLVENSIKHALEKVSYTTHISISAFPDGTNAVISVEDNGPGISEEKLGKIMRSLKTNWEDWTHESIGLKNLHDRLKLIFGDRAKLEIQSGDSGTKIRIIIPAEGGGEHVQSADH